MRVRNTERRSDERIELQMTPMIDVVFQLLIFFIFTFKVVTPEGDFNIKMPKTAPMEGLPDDDQLPPVVVRLTATPNGSLSNIRLGQNSLGRDFRTLHTRLRELVGDDRGPGSIAARPEVELDCDYNLKFKNVIGAISAISGYVDPTNKNNIIKVIEKIRFAPPKKARTG